MKKSSNCCICFKARSQKTLKHDIHQIDFKMTLQTNRIFYWIYKCHKSRQIQILRFKICLLESWVNIATQMNEKNCQTAAYVVKALSQKTLKDHIHQIEFKITLQTHKMFYWIYKCHKSGQIQILWFKICLPESWVNIATKMNEKNRQTAACVLKARSQ